MYSHKYLGKTNLSGNIQLEVVYLRKDNYPGELMLFSAIAGAMSALLKLLIHHAFVWLGLSTNFYEMLTAYFTHGHLHVEGFSEWIFGEMGDLTIGALFGIFLAFWLKASRKKYHWWIGLGYGFGIWFASLAFGNIAKIIENEMTTPWSLFAHLLAMLSFGLLFVLFSRYWVPLRDRLEVNEDDEDDEED